MRRHETEAGEDGEIGEKRKRLSKSTGRDDFLRLGGMEHEDKLSGPHHNLKCIHACSLRLVSKTSESTDSPLPTFWRLSEPILAVLATPDLHTLSGTVSRKNLTNRRSIRNPCRALNILKVPALAPPGPVLSYFNHGSG